MGPARVAFPVHGLGLGPIGPGRRSGGVADPPSECPFGAERGTERTALRRTLRLPFGAAVSDLGVAAVPVSEGVGWLAPGARRAERARLVVWVVGSERGPPCGEARSAVRATRALEVVVS